MAQSGRLKAGSASASCSMRAPVSASLRTVDSSLFSGLTLQPSRCRAFVRGGLTFTCGQLLVLKLNTTTTKINSRHWPGPGAGSYHSSSSLPVSLFFFFCSAFFCLSLSASGTFAPVCVCVCVCVECTRTKPGGQLWRERGGARVSTCSKEHMAHCLEKSEGRRQKWGKKI